MICTGTNVRNREGGREKEIRRDKWTIDHGNLVLRMKQGDGCRYWGENGIVVWGLERV